jgi:hypothetical protein
LLIFLFSFLFDCLLPFYLFILKSFLFSVYFHFFYFVMFCALWVFTYVRRLFALVIWKNLNFEIITLFLLLIFNFPKWKYGNNLRSLTTFFLSIIIFQRRSSCTHSLIFVRFGLYTFGMHSFQIVLWLVLWSWLRPLLTFWFNIFKKVIWAINYTTW